MTLQNGLVGRWGTSYERLTSTDEKIPKPKRRWAMKMQGKIKGFRLSRTKRLNWKAFSVVTIPRRMAEIYAEVVKRMKMDDICPTIVFCGQWGLPFLSHANVRYGGAISFDRNMDHHYQ